MAKANPSYYQTTAPVSAPVQYQEHLFHLFVQQQFEATNGANQLITVNPKLPQGFGVTVATDWDIRDGPDTTAKVVVRAQGLHQGSGKNNAAWFMSFNTVFTDERFKGSSLSVQGHLVSDEGEWVVTGGTGEFAFAQGGNGGTPFEIPEAELPQRLESVTIQSNEVIDSIAFTYIVQLGARRTIGPFGGADGMKQPLGAYVRPSPN
ncbi:hypothetical protein TRIUR3_32274 [Triticum urartu]|uniref:Dirigent protein n=1 Tax=Triticum urartu TaxID=4572 RepID=M7ZSY3_TRIUA|nr:hypothetical protein TRIUR3_32274 [Triticum urartu]